MSGEGITGAIAHKISPTLGKIYDIGTAIAAPFAGMGLAGGAGAGAGASAGAAASDSTGFAAPGAMGTPGMQSLTPQLPSWLQSVPGSNGGPPIAGVSVDTGTMNAPPAAGTNWLSALGTKASNLGSSLGIKSPADAVNTIAQAASAVQNLSPQQQQPSVAPAFRGGAGSPGFAQTLNGGGMQMPMRNQITPPTFNRAGANNGPNFQLLRALGFTG